MKKLYLFLPLFLAIPVFSLQAQEATLSKEKVKKLTDLTQKIEGTYQVQVINSRELPVIPIELAEIIENKRQVNDTAYYWLKPNIRVMILPRQVIQQPDFKKVEKIKHVAN